MLPIYLHDKSAIEAYLRRAPYLHLYALGDLDDFFWPYTSWVAARDGADITSLYLIYSGGGLPVVLAIAEEDRAQLSALLEASLGLLPRRFYTHLSPGLAEALRAGGYQLEPHGTFLKMGLLEPACLDAVDTSGVIQFGPADEPALRQLYAEAYPGNWFDPRMLETGCYYGVREGQHGPVQAVAGIHVYSPQYGAAALGNITTHPAQRGRGIAGRITARLCQSLRQTCPTIGLNVRADNAPALAAYTKLGFRPVAEYEEYMVTG